MQTTELFKTFQDVIVPERPAVLCSMHSRRLQSTQIHNAIHPQNRQAAESPHSVHQLTNHVCSLVLRAGALGYSTGSTTGWHQ